MQNLISTIWKTQALKAACVTCLTLMTISPARAADVVSATFMDITVILTDETGDCVAGGRVAKIYSGDKEYDTCFVIKNGVNGPLVIIDSGEENIFLYLSHFHTIVGA